ncbi:MAG: HEAT repeat domain-containing protein [Leptolyngbya sp. SIO1D8]|nr:HEAT repeat domain-containing protein [Leptolyngbya sp. SIO1D8]
MESAFQLLLEGDFQVRWEATKRISAFGDVAIAPLVTLLQDEELEWEIRWFAARTLGYLDNAEALSALVQLLQSTQDDELIAIAAEGLSRTGVIGIQALIDLFETPMHRVTAVRALAGIRHKAVLPSLLAAAEDRNPDVRALGLSALGNFRDPQVDTLFIQAVEDPVATVRKEAITHLGLRSYLLETTDLVDVLLPGLWDIHPSVNQATAIALGRLGTETAVMSLARVLTSPHTPESFQKNLVNVLGWIKRESALSALLSASQTVSTSIQLEIIETLTHLESPNMKQRAGAALYHWLERVLEETGADALKQAIAFALGHLHNEQSRPLLEKLAQDPDDRTRLYAQSALRQLAT